MKWIGISKYSNRVGGQVGIHEVRLPVCTQVNAQTSMQYLALCINCEWLECCTELKKERKM